MGRSLGSIALELVGKVALYTYEKVSVGSPLLCLPANVKMLLVSSS
jgi:hypothetical protein